MEYLGDLFQKREQPKEEFNMHFNKRKRNSMFQVLSPKKNHKNTNENPMDIFNANNDLNSILSRNLKSIYNEQKDDSDIDNPLFENVNSLIKKNINNNKKSFREMLNKENNNKESSSVYNVKKQSKKKFQKTAIIKSINFLKKESIKKNSIKKTIDISKKINIFPFNKRLSKRKSELKDKEERKKENNKKEKKKVVFREDIHHSRTPKNRSSLKKQGFSFYTKRKSSMFDNFKFNLKKPQVNIESMTPKNKNNVLDKLLKDKDIEFKNLSNNSGSISPINKRNLPKKNSFFSKDLKNNSLGNQNKRRFSVNVMNASLKSNLQPKSKFNRPRKTVFFESPKEKMIIPTLNQIHSAINKTIFETKIDKVKKELKNFEKNEISEIISNISPNKIKRKKFTDLAFIGLADKIQINNSENKRLSKNKEVLINKIDNINNMTNNFISEEERIQNKYRKLYLSKNLYDSLDDEEMMDEDEQSSLYISPNSYTVYILDFFVLISSVISLFALPLYISIYLPSYAAYSSIFASFIFYFVDLIYIIDLITGFFRAYYNFEEVLITKNLNICIKYLKGWFLLDLIGAIPFYTLLNKNMNKIIKNFLDNNADISNRFDFGLNNEYYALTLLKIFKIFKTFSFNKLFKATYKSLDKIQFFYEWKGLFFSLFVTLSTLHICTCFYVFIGRNEFNGWLLRNSLQDESYINLYIASLYYQITTLTTVGYGDMTPTNGIEHAYGIFILIVGTCVYSWIVTYISNYIKKNNEKFIDFEEKMKVLNEIKMEYPNLNKNLNERIVRYLNYNKSEYKYNLKFILESLPSSLQNNLIIEIYKPIIMNFQFFKSFENSDFFVKIVTSLKPILSMKDDILINEGDIIEDIIFIKKGVLSLEIILDLKDVKKSVESHLEMTGMECFKNISYKKFNTLMNINSLNPNYKAEFAKKFKNKYIRKKEIKIIDLRKNEHFGDILMILNEKSPLAVKVKSKKAELFFLQKTEATEISNRYSNIWKRIVNRSLHNMKQIKNLIRRKIFLFVETYNIEINKEIKEKYLKNGQLNHNNITPKDKIKQNKSTKHIETILEEDESNLNQSQWSTNKINRGLSSKDKNQKTLTGETSENKSTQISKSKSSVIKNRKPNLKETEYKIENPIVEKNSVENESIIKDNEENSKKNEQTFTFKDSKKNNSSNNETKNIEINNNITGLNNMISIVDKEFINTTKNNNITNFNINIYTPNVHFPLSQLNIENQNSSRINLKEKEEENNDYDSFILGKVKSEISFNKEFEIDIKHNNILMNNLDENNIIFFNNNNYNNNKIKENKDDKSSNVSEDYNSNIDRLLERGKYEKNNSSQKQKEKTEIKTDDKISIKSISSDQSKISNKNQEKEPINKVNKFSDLSSSQSTAFSINSIYYNINQVSKFNFQKDSDLREKTRQFIIQQIDKENNGNITINKINAKSSKFLDIKSNMNLNIKKPIVRKKSENITKSNILNKNENLNLIKRSTIKRDEKDFNEHKNNENNIKKEEEEKQEQNESKKSIPIVNINNINTITKPKSPRKKPVKKNESINTKDKTFYNKIHRLKTMKKRRVNSIETKPEKEHKNNKVNYDKLISKNIEKNQKNLNNPEEYFEGFFNNIILYENEESNLKSDVKKSGTFDN